MIVLNSGTAWAVGEWGTRLRTEDGGLSWQDHSLTIDEQHPQFVWLTVDEKEKVRAGERVFSRSCAHT